MTHETEAEALLRSGNLFTRRGGFRDSGGGIVLVGRKVAAFAIYQGDAPYAHFDLDGRWQRVFRDGTHFLKHLDGHVDAIDREREGPNMVLRRRTLSAEEATALDNAVRRWLLDLLRARKTETDDILSPPRADQAMTGDEIQDLIELAASWDEESWRNNRELAAATYQPVAYPPPDAPNAVVLQAALGGSWFSRLRREPATQSSQFRDLTAFREHARAVRTLLGRRLAQARGLFLDAPELLHRPIEDVAAYLEIIHETFPTRLALERGLNSPDMNMPTLSRIDIFLDEVCPPLPDRDGWRRLKALDLGRVNLRFGPGGSLDSRKEEPGWSTEGFHELIENLKKETIPVGIWIPVALGGREWAVPPLDRLIDQLDALPLDPRDLIILIEDEAGVPPIEGRPIEWLDPTRLDPPATGFRERLRPRRTRRGVKIVSYKPEKQGF